MITIDLVVEIDLEIAEAMLIGNDHWIGEDAEVENEITVIGETILMMIGLEDAARILLTHGLVAEETKIADRHPDQIVAQKFMMLQKHQHPLRKPRNKRKQNV